MREFKRHWLGNNLRSSNMSAALGPFRKIYGSPGCGAPRAIPAIPLDRSDFTQNIISFMHMPYQLPHRFTQPNDNSHSGGIMPNEGLKELYIDELKDLYSAENQLVKALPKMAKAASSEELRQGFEEHLEQTKEHVARLEKIFDALDESPKGKKCMGMEGLVKEGSEVMGEDFEDAVMDAALIGAAQRVEHYEIAAYGTASEFANLLGESEHVSLLQETLQEEKETDEKLTELAKQINQQANEGGEEMELDEEVELEEEEDKPKTAKSTRKPSRRVA
jgi:ferritin-like metal-binding protein YciE